MESVKCVSGKCLRRHYFRDISWAQFILNRILNTSHVGVHPISIRSSFLRKNSTMSVYGEQCTFSHLLETLCCTNRYTVQTIVYTVHFIACTASTAFQVSSPFKSERSVSLMNHIVRWMNVFQIQLPWSHWVRTSLQSCSPASVRCRLSFNLLRCLINRSAIIWSLQQYLKQLILWILSVIASLCSVIARQEAFFFDLKVQMLQVERNSDFQHKWFRALVSWYDWNSLCQSSNPRNFLDASARPNVLSFNTWKSNKLFLSSNRRQKTQMLHPSLPSNHSHISLLKHRHPVYINMYNRNKWFTGSSIS